MIPDPWAKKVGVFRMVAKKCGKLRVACTNWTLRQIGGILYNRRKALHKKSGHPQHAEACRYLLSQVVVDPSDFLCKADSLLYKRPCKYQVSSSFSRVYPRKNSSVTTMKIGISTNPL